MATRPSVEGSCVEPRIRQRREEVGNRRRRRWSRLVVSVTALFVLLVGAAVALHSPLLSARHIVVKGAVHTSPAEIETAAVTGHPPLLDISVSAVATRVEALPWVDRAYVTRDWPDTLTIRVTERTPVAVVAEAGRWALVDGSGRVLATEPSAPPGLVELTSPAVAGGPGATLDDSASPGLEVAASLPPVLSARVRAVTVDQRGSVTLELGAGVTAVLGPATDLSAKFESLASVLAGAPPSGPSVIDVTVPEEPEVGPA